MAKKTGGENKNKISRKEEEIQKNIKADKKTYGKRRVTKKES